MKIVKASYYKNPFIGLFIKTNNSVTLFPKQAPRKTIESAHQALKTKAVELFINQSPLVGLMAALNDNGVILAGQAEKEEVKTLKKEGLNVYVMKESIAPGNAMLANSKAALVSTLVSRVEASKIGDCLGVEVVQLNVGSIRTIGSINVVTNKGLFAYNDITEVELKNLERIFGVHGELGSTNTGVQFNALGVVANDSGALVGDLTTGFELQRIYQALSGE